jgi:hypothetical protein
MPMKLTVHDTAFVPRTVEIPDECPECGADLRLKNAIVEWAWEDRGHCGSFEANERFPEGLGDLAYGHETGQGDSWYGVELRCDDCSHELASGRELEEVAAELTADLRIALDSESAIATILAALRLFQENRGRGEAMSHFDETTPLTDDQIDQLCEKLNS